MKPIRTATLTLLLLLLFPLRGRGEEPLSLTHYCDRVLHYAIQLKIEGEQLRIAEWQRELQHTLFLPQLAFTGDASLDLRELNAWSGVEGEYRNHTYLAQLSLQQPLYQGGTVRNNYRAQKLEVERAALLSSWSRINIRYQAQVAYWNVVANQAFFAATQEYYTIIAQLQRVIEIRFREGEIAKSDLLLIDTRLKEAELQRSTARKNWLLALQSFNLLMGDNPHREVVLSDSLVGDFSLPPFVSLEEVLDERPDYQLKALATLQQEYYRRAALGSYNPKVWLSLSGGWGTTTPNTGYKPNWSGLAAVTLTVPIPWMGDRGYSRRSGLAAVRIKEWEEQMTRDVVAGELSRSITELQQRNREIVLVGERVLLAGESLELTTYAYREGRIPIADVLSSQIAWIQAQSSRIAAYLAYRSAWADYQRIIGER